jgi:diguanylate cyclase (GGDEF)-like protein
MTYKKYLSIRNKQIMVIMTVSVIILGLAASLFFLYELDNEEQRISTEIDNKATLIAANIASTLLFNDTVSANETLRTLKVDPSVLMAVLFDEEDKPFASYSQEGYASQIEAYKLQPEGVYLGDIFVEVFRPAVIQNSRVGTVYIRSDLTGFEEKIINYSYIVLFIFMASLILAAFLTHQFQKIITTPIEKLAQLVSQVSKDKDYSMRLPIKSRDEIGVLVRAFNGMLKTVEEHKEKLQNQTNNLEQLVRIRSEQLHKLAYFDALTGLPNRSLLFQEIEKEISRCNRTNLSFALMFLDLDRFKTINDSLGHAVGDELLQEAARRLLDSVRKEDVVARIGGDEFVVMLVNIKSRLKVSSIAENIMLAFSYPFNLILNSTSLHVSVSIGVSVYPEHGHDVADLMRNADTSMYQTKAIAPGKYVFYEEAMNVATQRLLAVENQLREAIKNNEFTIVYQPQVKLADSKMVGVEALLRWSNPRLGTVPPAEFIPLAEELGLIGEIGVWVVEKVSEQCKVWKDEGYASVKISVNVSASQLVSINLVEHIKNMLITYQIDSHDIEIEITEDVFLDKSDRNIAQLTELKNLNMRIAIDDFGTGYSSLSYLQNFPCDVLKLDGSFVKKIGQNKTSEDLVTATIILAHSLGLEMIAECVETKAQLDFLKNAGCDMVQGYYYSKPLTVEEMGNLMEKHAIDRYSTQDEENNKAMSQLIVEIVLFSQEMIENKKLA